MHPTRCALGDDLSLRVLNFFLVAGLCLRGAATEGWTWPEDAHEPRTRPSADFRQLGDGERERLGREDADGCRCVPCQQHARPSPRMWQRLLCGRDVSCCGNDALGFTREPHYPADAEFPQILVGPGGPAGTVGPTEGSKLVRPGGFTGHADPNDPGVLVGPGGPVGTIGPASSGSRRKPNVLVGPGGPTGIIGPDAPRVLVGPGGPTGIVGPARSVSSHRMRTPAAAVLVGPGGPTGIVGPRRGRAGTT